VTYSKLTPLLIKITFEAQHEPLNENFTNVRKQIYEILSLEIFLNSIMSLNSKYPESVYLLWPNIKDGYKWRDESMKKNKKIKKKKKKKKTLNLH